MVNTYICHHGIKGQKWGVRRYQNYDGTLKDSARKIKTKVKDYYHDDKGNLDKKKVAKTLAVGSTVALGIAVGVGAGIQVSKVVNNRNLKLGAVYANRVSDIAYNSLHNPNVQRMNQGLTQLTRVNNERFSSEASKMIGAKAGENFVNSLNKQQKIKNALDYNKIISGTKSLHGSKDFDEAIKDIIKSESVLEGGNGRLAKLIRDSINSGGIIDKKWR